MSTFANSRDSPLSDVGSESGFGTMSMRDKALIKRNINRQHNGNYRAGYVPVHEQALHKTGLRGRKTYAFWTLVVLLFFLALGNLLLTFIILGVLRLGQGMESLELIPDENLIVFYGNTDLDRIYKRDGKIEGFGDQPIEVLGDKGSLLVNIADKDGKFQPKLALTLNGTAITSVRSFEVKDPANGKMVFSTDFPNFGLPRGVKELQVEQAYTDRISSAINGSLELRSDGYTRLKGSEGTHMDGREIVWSADQDIFLKSVNGSIILSGHEGVALDIGSIPIVTLDKAQTGPKKQFKVCVCMPGGKLFRVQVPQGDKSQGSCDVDLSSTINPCM